MSLAQGRIVKSPENATTVRIDLRLQAPAGPSATGRVVPKQIVEASEQAKARIEEAQAKAKQIIAEAERRREGVLSEAREIANGEAEAKLAQAWIRFHARRARAAEEALETNVEMARVLAERILGEQVRLQPESIQAIAMSALKSLGRSRQIRIMASSQSATQLRAILNDLQGRYDIVEIVEESGRPDTDLRFECDLGILDASIGSQLDRLASALRDALSREE
jgi:flagellar biosynthesis/type III secretory pathway protein FliH